MKKRNWLFKVSSDAIRHAEYWRVQGPYYQNDALEQRDNHILRRVQARNIAKRAQHAIGLAVVLDEEDADSSDSWDIWGARRADARALAKAVKP